MNFNTVLPGMKDVQITSIEENEMGMIVHVQMPSQAQCCPACGQMTSHVHNYRLQKIRHLKWFKRTTFLFYKRRRYRCTCGKRFAGTLTKFMKKFQIY